MKKLVTLALITTFAVSQSIAQQLTVKNDKAKIEFFVVADKQEGTIGGFEATLKFDPASPSTASIKGSVDVNTIDTDNSTRDKHLVSEDYFHAEKYPKMSFESNSVKATDDGYTMEGDMTIKGTTKPVTIDFTFENDKLKGKSIIYGKDFGIEHSWKDREDSKIYLKFNIPVK